MMHQNCTQLQQLSVVRRRSEVSFFCVGAGPRPSFAQQLDGLEHARDAAAEVRAEGDEAEDDDRVAADRGD